MSQDSVPDTGFVKRGLIMLVLMAALVVVVLVILLQRPQQALPKDDSANTKTPSPAGWEIRYAAAKTLANRGSEQVPWKIFEEMLDEPQQMRNQRVQLQDGKDVPFEAGARMVMLSALRAIGQWHVKHPERPQLLPAELEQVYAEVDSLVKHPITEIRVQADKTRQKFFR